MLFHWKLITRFRRCYESSVRLIIGHGNSYSTRLQSVRFSVCSRNSPQPCLDPPESEWHDGQRRINEAGKCIRTNTALRRKFRGGVRVQAYHAAV